MKNTIVNAITKEVMSIYEKDITPACRQLGTNNPKYVRLAQLDNLIEATKGHAKEKKLCKGAVTYIGYQCTVTFPVNMPVILSLVCFDKDNCFGWEVTHINGSTVTMKSPIYYKLQSLSKILDIIGKVNKISFSRIDTVDNTVLEKFSTLNKDTIKELQKKDRAFSARMVTDRADKKTRHVLAK
jgi:hypothetical protein